MSATLSDHCPTGLPGSDSITRLDKETQARKDKTASEKSAFLLLEASCVQFAASCHRQLHRGKKKHAVELSVANQAIH